MSSRPILSHPRRGEPRPGGKYRRAIIVGGRLVLAALLLVVVYHAYSAWWFRAVRQDMADAFDAFDSRPNAHDPRVKGVDGAAITSLPPIAVVTMNIIMDPAKKGDNWLHSMSYRNKRAYCDRWGYDLIVESNAMWDRSRPPVWSKLPILRKWLPKYQWVLWMDMDALFMNFSLPIDRLLPMPNTENVKSDVIVSFDFNTLNMGMVLLRNADYALFMFGEMWRMPPYFQQPWFEQSAMISLVAKAHSGPLVSTRHRAHFLKVPQKEINAYPIQFCNGQPKSEFHPGDFIVHFPDCKRVAHCRDIVELFYHRSLLNNAVAEKFKTLPIDDAWLPDAGRPARQLAEQNMALERKANDEAGEEEQRTNAERRALQDGQKGSQRKDEDDARAAELKHLPADVGVTDQP
jgi:hypothetical protein